MVQKLQENIYGAVKANELLRKNNECLKRWIGKRSLELGLTKHIPSDGQKKVSPAEAAADDMPHSLLTRGSPPPPPHNADSGIGTTRGGEVTTDQRRPKAGSPPPREQTADRPQLLPQSALQSPWVVDSVVREETKTPERVKDTLTPERVKETPNPERVKDKPTPERVNEARAPTPDQFILSPQRTAAQLAGTQPVVMASGPPVVYVPKDAIIVVQGDSRTGGTVRAGTLDPRLLVSPQPAAGPPEVLKADMPGTLSGSSSSSSALLHGDVKNHRAASPGRGEETTAANPHRNEGVASMDPATVTAIQSLLKLGYSIKVPDAALQVRRLPAEQHRTEPSPTAVQLRRSSQSP
ncbi:uncharacterized protein LOC143287471 [Babylonia areolata]|uniref:uncharacterized protein LOC143287471 n=1 Tax=Babylonia areolata TaxID=304850 RepID=UPI003FD088BB